LDRARRRAPKTQGVATWSSNSQPGGFVTCPGGASPPHPDRCQKGAHGPSSFEFRPRSAAVYGALPTPPNVSKWTPGLPPTTPSAYFHDVEYIIPPKARAPEDRRGIGGLGRPTRTGSPMRRQGAFMLPFKLELTTLSRYPCVSQGSPLLRMLSAQGRHHRNRPFREKEHRIAMSLRGHCIHEPLRT
jgi:hypothetical protein